MIDACVTTLTWCGSWLTLVGHDAYTVQSVLLLPLASLAALICWYVRRRMLLIHDGSTYQAITVNLVTVIAWAITGYAAYRVPVAYYIWMDASHAWIAVFGWLLSLVTVPLLLVPAVLVWSRNRQVISTLLLLGIGVLAASLVAAAITAWYLLQLPTPGHS